MKRGLFVACATSLLTLHISASEPSAFGAGDLNNPTPYGLTPSEEVILENKKKLNKVVVKSNNQANEVDSLRERIDGLQTIIESLSRKSQENKIKIQKIDTKNLQDLENQDQYEQRLSEIVQKNSEEIEKLKLAIAELSVLIDSINTSYVSKDEFNQLVKDVNNFKSLTAKELKSKSSGTKFDGKSLGDIATQAKKYYDKKYYTKSIEHYQYLIKKNYKPARAHYMIGEMYYYRKNYADAIAYFKKSAKLYSKASYMPNLMLHTGVSMRKTGDKKNAKAFLNGVMQKYPDTKYAKEAKKQLSYIK